ncbi:hypothetical protein THAOC_31141 [Thalassiosira oceanica]|uniref:Uncharacterized protein n=1 Tax=Thalassiosira oceanica TaxID=159749 RepID=K0RTB9_THAOC|nr:hypothetical protein THAOC_31141 [Thalassiosira oceanica]|eukprot:EJK49937.1 hypothetical protein THAOC_31141 [Thalassiosira oceanica]
MLPTSFVRDSPCHGVKPEYRTGFRRLPSTSAPLTQLTQTAEDPYVDDRGVTTEEDEALKRGSKMRRGSYSDQSSGSPGASPLHNAGPSAGSRHQTTKIFRGTNKPPTMGTRAIEEGSPPPRMEGGPGKGGASTHPCSLGCLASPDRCREAPGSGYNANDDPMAAVRWTNDVSSDDTDDESGPPALPMVCGFGCLCKHNSVLSTATKAIASSSSVVTPPTPTHGSSAVRVSAAEVPDYRLSPVRCSGLTPRQGELRGGGGSTSSSSFAKDNFTSSSIATIKLFRYVSHQFQRVAHLEPPLRSSPDPAVIIYHPSVILTSTHGGWHHLWGSANCQRLFRARSYIQATFLHMCSSHGGPAMGGLSFHR